MVPALGEGTGKNYHLEADPILIKVMGLLLRQSTFHGEGKFRTVPGRVS